MMATPNFVIVSDEDLNELLSDNEAASMMGGPKATHFVYKR